MLYYIIFINILDNIAPLCPDGSMFAVCLLLQSVFITQDAWFITQQPRTHGYKMQQPRTHGL